MWKFEYTIIFLFFLIAIGLSALLVLVNYLFSPHVKDLEKQSAYECGFDPFEDSRLQFNVQYYLVGILFLIFDLEIIYLLPWSLHVDFLGFFGFETMMFFLVLLTIGFIYEWFVGALNW